jgi:hypothetical protein
MEGIRKKREREGGREREREREIYGSSKKQDKLFSMKLNLQKHKNHTR